MTSQHCVLGVVAAEGCMPWGIPFGARAVGAVLPGAAGVSAPPLRSTGEGAASGLRSVATPERSSPAPAPALNGRDVELLRHLAAGASTARAAAALSVTSNTVRTRIRRIQVKLGVVGRGDAVRRARESGTI